MEQRKRMTLVMTPDVELLLNQMKQELFENCSRSEMIRILITEGLNVLEKKNKREVI